LNREGLSRSLLPLPFLIVIICSTTLPVLGLQDSKSISSYGTVSYSRTSAGSAVWMRAEDLLDAPNPSLVLEKLIRGKIKFLFLLTGEWRTDGTILYYLSDSRITKFINTVKARSTEFKVLAWVYLVPPYHERVDLSSEAIKSTMIKQTVSCVQKGFDGFNDDVEGFLPRGEWKQIVDFWNRQADAVRKIGKIATNCISCAIYYAPEWIRSVAPYVNTDYMAAMLYNGGPFYPADVFKEAMNSILTHSASPILIGMRVDNYTTYPLKTQLTWIDEKIASSGPYPKLAGFVLYDYRLMRDIDWTDWNNWATKDKYA